MQVINLNKKHSTTDQRIIFSTRKDATEQLEILTTSVFCVTKEDLVTLFREKGIEALGSINIHCIYTDQEYVPKRLRNDFSLRLLPSDNDIAIAFDVSEKCLTKCWNTYDQQLELTYTLGDFVNNFFQPEYASLAVTKMFEAISTPPVSSTEMENICKELDLTNRFSPLADDEDTEPYRVPRRPFSKRHNRIRCVVGLCKRKNSPPRSRSTSPRKAASVPIWKAACWPRPNPGINYPRKWSHYQYLPTIEKLLPLPAQRHSDDSVNDLSSNMALYHHEFMCKCANWMNDPDTQWPSDTYHHLWREEIVQHNGIEEHNGFFDTLSNVADVLVNGIEVKGNIQHSFGPNVDKFFEAINSVLAPAGNVPKMFLVNVISDLISALTAYRRQDYLNVSLSFQRIVTLLGFSLLPTPDVMFSPKNDAERLFEENTMTAESDDSFQQHDGYETSTFAAIEWFISCIVGPAKSYINDFSTACRKFCLAFKSIADSSTVVTKIETLIKKIGEWFSSICSWIVSWFDKEPSLEEVIELMYRPLYFIVSVANGNNSLKVVSSDINLSKLVHLAFKKLDQALLDLENKRQRFPKDKSLPGLISSVHTWLRRHHINELRIAATNAIEESALKQECLYARMWSKPGSGKSSMIKQFWHDIGLKLQKNADPNDPYDPWTETDVGTGPSYASEFLPWIKAHHKVGIVDDMRVKLDDKEGLARAENFLIQACSSTPHKIQYPCGDIVSRWTECRFELLLDIGNTPLSDPVENSLDMAITRRCYRSIEVRPMDMYAKYNEQEQRYEYRNVSKMHRDKGITTYVTTPWTKMYILHKYTRGTDNKMHPTSSTTFDYEGIVNYLANEILFLRKCYLNNKQELDNLRKYSTSDLDAFIGLFDVKDALKKKMPVIDPDEEEQTLHDLYEMFESWMNGKEPPPFLYEDEISFFKAMITSIMSNARPCINRVTRYLDFFRSEFGFKTSTLDSPDDNLEQHNGTEEATDTKTVRKVDTSHPIYQSMKETISEMLTVQNFIDKLRGLGEHLMQLLSYGAVVFCLASYFPSITNLNIDKVEKLDFTANNSFQNTETAVLAFPESTLIMTSANEQEQETTQTHLSESLPIAPTERPSGGNEASVSAKNPWDKRQKKEESKKEFNHFVNSMLERMEQSGEEVIDASSVNEACRKLRCGKNTGCCFVVDSKHLITCTHVAKKFNKHRATMRMNNEDPDPIYISNGTDWLKAEVTSFLELNKVEPLMHNNYPVDRDVCVMILEKPLPGCKNKMSFLLDTDYDYVKTYNNKVEMRCPRLENGQLIGYNSEGFMSINHHVPGKYKATYKGREGDSGAPVFASIKGQIKLIGIHGGVDLSDKKSVVSVFSRHWLDSLMLEKHTGFEDILPEGCEFEGLVSSAKEKYFLPAKSKLTKTIFHPDNCGYGTCTVAPAALRPFRDEEGNLISPLAKGLEKYGNNRMSKPIVYEDDFAQWLFANGIRNYVISHHASINGFDTGTNVLPPLERKTAAGYPWKDHKGKHLVSIGNGEYEPDSELALYLDILYEKTKTQPHRFTFVGCTKDEKRPIEKVKAGKTRVFMICPLDGVITGRRFFGYVGSSFKRHCTSNNGVRYGINPHSPEQWASFMESHSRFDNHFDCDFSNFDGAIPTEVLLKVCDILFELTEMSYKEGNYDEDLVDEWNDETKAQFRNIYHGYVYKRVLISDTFFSLNHSNPSGIPITTTLNSIINLYYHYCAFKQLCPDKIFQEDCQVSVYGDDVLVSTNDPRFFPEPLSAWFAKHNCEYTSAEKSGQIASLKDIEQVSFLKRQFKYVEGLCRAPLHWESIYNSLCWTENPGDMEVLNSICNSALLEATHHGKAAFNDLLVTICREYERHGLPYSWKSFDEYVNVSFQEHVGKENTTTIGNGNDPQAMDNSTQNRVETHPVSSNVTLDHDVQVRGTEGDTPSVVDTNRVGITEFATNATNSNVVQSAAPHAVVDELVAATSIPDFLSHPTIIQSYNLASSDTANKIVLAFDPLRLFLAKQSFRSKAIGFRYLRCEIVLRITCNCSTKMFGRYIIMWLNRYQVYNVGNVYTTRTKYTVHNWPEFQHAYLDCTGNTEIIMRIPFLYPLFAIDLIDNSATDAFMGQILMGCLTPIQGISGTGAGTVNFFAHLENVQLYGHNLTPWKIPPYAPLPLDTWSYWARLFEENYMHPDSLMKKRTEEVEGTLDGIKLHSGVEEALGMVRDVTNTLGNVSDVFKPVSKFVGDLTDVAAPIAGIVSTLGPILGAFERPVDVRADDRTILKQPGLAETRGLNPAETAAFNRDAHIAPMLSYMDTEPCDHDLRNVAQIPMLLANVQIPYELNRNDVVYKWQVSPINVPVSGVDFELGIYEKADGFMSACAGAFQYWRGGIRIYYDFIRSSFHTGMVRLSFFPGSGDIQIDGTWDADQYWAHSFSKVVDLSNAAACRGSFFCPWEINEPALRVTPTQVDPRWTSGVLYVTIVNPMTCDPATAAPPSMLLSVGAGPDISFFRPSIHFLADGNDEKSPWTPSPPGGEEAKKKSEESKIVPHVGEEAMAAKVRKVTVNREQVIMPTANFNGETPDVFTKMSPDCTMSEECTNVLTLVRRAFLLRSPSKDKPAPFNATCRIDPFAPSQMINMGYCEDQINEFNPAFEAGEQPSYFSTKSFYNYFRKMYCCMRGSYQIIVLSPDYAPTAPSPAICCFNGQPLSADLSYSNTMVLVERIHGSGLARCGDGAILGAPDSVATTLNIPWQSNHLFVGTYGAGIIKNFPDSELASRNVARVRGTVHDYLIRMGDDFQFGALDPPGKSGFMQTQSSGLYSYVISTTSHPWVSGELATHYLWPNDFQLGQCDYSDMELYAPSP